ncbi:MAG: amino acid permease [Acidimicrobiia bacterium]|jgi:amino acid transporter
MLTEPNDTATAGDAAAARAGAADGPGPALGPHTVLPEEDLGFRVKRKLLGPALPTSDLEHERLGKPTALAVFASDNLSSSAYATEEILRVLVPVVGLAAFSLVVPITLAMVAVLGLLILSYRQTIKAYPSAGGAYMVTRDNFGILPAQVAGVALLTDYILTVSVSVAAGTAALASAFSELTPYVVPISIAFVIIIAYGNLRGVRESGKIFAVPTYFFLINMVVLLGYGAYQLLTGSLATAPQNQHGMMHFGGATGGLFYGATLFVVLHAFASGGAAVTGVEAISNGVPAFRKPEWKNARSTLVIMGSLLGVMFLGLSVMAAHMKVVPFKEGTPTVISQIGDLTYGTSPVGRFFYLALQAGTMLILVMAANTSFADFPRLASFHAEDNFMPRKLTKRGHRLVFSNGIIFLSIAAIALLLVTGAKVDKLIPLYAIGVFTSFTLSQAGMAKHHLTEREPKWRSGFVINASGAIVSALVTFIVAVTKFTHGAWLIILLVPILVFFLMRLARQYAREEEQLEVDVPEAAQVPVRRRLSVLVLVDRVDLATARAMHFGRSLHPDDLKAVHFVLDEHRAHDLTEQWRAGGLGDMELELVECSDRRLPRAAMLAAARVVADGKSEVCVVLPDRRYQGLWRRILHDQTADALSRALSRLPHVTVSMVPFNTKRPGRPDAEVLAALGGAPSGNGHRASTPSGNGARGGLAGSAPVAAGTHGSAGIGAVVARDRVTVTGRIHSVRMSPIGGSPALECTLTDDTGTVSVVFYGRRAIPGINVGARLSAEGMVGDHRGRLALINPEYHFVG